MSDTETYFYQKFEQKFGTYDVADEDIHESYKAEKPHFGLSETQYFGFSIPEQNIHAFLYLWYHPNLNVLAGGPMIMKGVKPFGQGSEIFDYRNYFPDEQLNPSLTNFKLDSSYGVEMLQPGREFRLTYEDASRDSGYDVVATAVSDIIMWPSSRHFEQVMRVKGELRMRGERYVVDGYNVRDRSWGELRLENPIAGSPIIWTTGVFGDDFAFNMTGFDSPELNPVWLDKLPPSDQRSHKFGWMIIDGTPVVVEDSKSVTRYNPATLLPEAIDIQVQVNGRRYDIKGTITAGAPHSPWLNNRCPICLVRWECEGRVGWGDFQSAQGTDFLNALSQS